MKNRIKYIIGLAFVFSLLFAVNSYALANPEVSSMTAEATEEYVSVTGTLDLENAAAVVIQVLDEGSIIGMESFAVDETSFGGTLFGLTLTKGNTYTVRAANYDGGEWFITTVTVPNDPNPVPTSTGHRYVEGWVQDNIGWWYRRSNGSWPANCWVQLPWKGNYEWYHFDVNGYMQTGWFTDVDGRKYYLWPISDDSMGRMLYGPQIIGGVQYIFNTSHDGYFGCLK